MGKTALAEALKLLNEQEREAVRKLWREQKRIEAEARRLKRQNYFLRKTVLNESGFECVMELRMKNPLKNNRGSINLVVALIVTVVVLVVGVYVLATFQGAVPNITNTTANQTATSLFNVGWNAFGLAVVIPLIVVAGAIIGYIVRGFQGASAGR